MPKTWKTDTSDRVFKDACNGYGFEEVPQEPEGLYCEGCMTAHKRPTKMYSNGERGLGKCLCRFQVCRLFNPEDQ